MKKYVSCLISVAAVLYATSCNKEQFAQNVPDNHACEETICLRASKPQDDAEISKVTYHDNLGTDGKGSGFSMEWEEGDELYAIMWDDNAEREGGKKGKATNKYIVLTTVTTEQGGEMLFSGSPKGFSLSDLKGGEHFVLVHGHFVLDADTDGGVIDFPTSEVTKAGYASHIHHGGVENKTDLTFRNQDGTLANLKWHEYMVADSYVRFQQNPEGEGRLPYLGKERASYGQNDFDDSDTVNAQGVQMLSAHTLLRLTLFIPDDMFSGLDKNLFAVSLKTTASDQIFHRYFRLHPNDKTGQYGPAGWKEDWNDHNDKEANSYLRVNFPGNRLYNEINVPGTKDFDQSKTVCVKKELNGISGHFVTLYFSLPSRPLAPDNALDSPCPLYVSAFTQTHTYRTNKTYTITADKMKPGKVVNLNVSFASTNRSSSTAITDPNLGVTFSPGLVYAYRQSTSDSWSYSVYDNQGEYAGVAQQSDVMGDYFVFGSVDPRNVYHEHTNNTKCPEALQNLAKSTLTADNDVAAKATIGTLGNIFSMMTKKEAERVWAHLDSDAKTKGVNKGFYYYNAFASHDDALHHTAHQAIGAWKGLAENDPRRQMSSTMGIWIGVDHQPTLEEQDMYVFIPSSHQLDNKHSSKQYKNLEGVLYYVNDEYGKQHVECKSQAEYDQLTDEQKKGYVDIPTPHSNGETFLHHWYKKSELMDEINQFSGMTMKFSTNTREYAGNNTDYRFQLWYKDGDKSKPWGTFNVGIAALETSFGRVVRPVIY